MRGRQTLLSAFIPSHLRRGDYGLNQRLPFKIGKADFGHFAGGKMERGTFTEGEVFELNSKTEPAVNDDPWCLLQDSNLQPLGPKPSALSS